MRDGFFWLIPLTAILGWATVAIVSMRTRARLRELEIRERIAMIEKGLLPSPEKDPEAFDRVMKRYDRPRHRRPGRTRRIGIIMIGVGLGAMVVIWSAGGRAGVGAFFVILGLAFVINSFFEERERAGLPQTGIAPPPPPQPPTA